MGTILTYLDEYGGYNFVEKPLCEIDGLILAHLSYYVYDNVVPGPEEQKSAVSTKYIREHMNKESFLSVVWDEEVNRELFYKILESRRFRSMKANYYVNLLNQEQELQFCAITFLLGNGDVFLSFRGTDDALVGWKEDFRMAYRTPVEAQKKSAEYLETVARRLYRKKHARIYLGGHSKGGNLATYAAMCCDSRIKHKIGKIYDYDGPGFRPDFLETLDYRPMREKMEKFVPKDSFVGMLMQGDGEDAIKYTLIESTRIGLMQHIPLSWCIEDDRFVRAVCEVPERKKLYDRMNQWIYSIEKERLELFLNKLFELIDLTEVETLTDLRITAPELLKKSRLVRETFKGLDEEAKSQLWEIARMVAELLAKDQQERIRRWKLIEKLRAERAGK